MDKNPFVDLAAEYMPEQPAPGGREEVPQDAATQDNPFFELAKEYQGEGDLSEESPTIGEHIKSFANRAVNDFLNFPAQIAETAAIGGVQLSNLLTGEDKRVSDDALYRWAEDYRKAKTDILPSDPRLKGTLEDEVAGGLGQVGSQVALALATQGRGNGLLQTAKEASRQALKQTATSMGVGVTMGTGEGYQDAANTIREKKGIPADQPLSPEDERVAQMSANWGAILGTSEAIPISNLFGIVERAVPAAGKKLFEIGIETLEEGGQEAFQTAMSNWWAQRNYDEKRAVMDGVGQATEVGGTVGFIAATLAMLLTGKRPHLPEIKTNKAREAEPVVESASLEPGLAEAMAPTPEVEEGRAFTDAELDAQIEKLGPRDIKPEMADTLSGAGFGLKGFNSPEQSAPVAPPAPITETQAQTFAQTAQPELSIDELAHQAATSPHSDIQDPSERQKEKGVYKVGPIPAKRTSLNIPISIENPAGSVRSGTAPDGTKWESPMAHHYGYLKGTVGYDKDHLDIFLTPGAEQAQSIFIIDQIDPETGEFDEHKLVLGPASAEEAEQAYLANYGEGWQGVGAITQMPVAEGKKWAKSSAPSKGALAYVKPEANPFVALAEETEQEPLPDFKTEEEHQVDEITRLLNEEGVALESPLRSKLVDERRQTARVPDRVTGLIRGDHFEPTMGRAWREHTENGRPFAYGVADLRNLGGLNKHAGGEAQADKYYRKLAEILKETVTKKFPKAQVIRKGGDEIGIIAPGVDSGALDAIMKTAGKKIDAWVKQSGLDAIPHPKGGAPGFGIYHAAVDFSGHESMDSVMESADAIQALEKVKKEEEHRESKRKAEEARTESPRGQSRRVEEGTREESREGSDAAPTEGRVPVGRTEAQKRNDERLRKQRTVVDPERDDLLVAISKLGGIDKGEASSQWGKTITDTDFRKRQVFGKPVLKKSGGLSIDKMLSSLKGHGFFGDDADQNDLLSAIDRAIRGDAVRSEGQSLSGEDVAKMEFDYLSSKGVDPFDFTDEDLSDIGYDELDAESRDAFEAAYAEAVFSLSGSNELREAERLAAEGLYKEAEEAIKEAFDVQSKGAGKDKQSTKEQAAEGQERPGKGTRQETRGGREYRIDEGEFADFGTVSEAGEQTSFNFDVQPETGKGRDERDASGGRDIQPPGRVSVFRRKGFAPVPRTTSARLEAQVDRVQTGTFKTGIDKVETASDAAHIFAPLRKKSKENFAVLALDKKGRPLAILDISTGSTNASIVHPAIVVGAALDVPGVAKVWFAHNHPSGDPSPSLEDRNITERIKNVLDGSGVTLEGHVVIGRNGEFSSVTNGIASPRQKPTAAPRSKDVPVMDDRLVRAPDDSKRVTDDVSARRIISSPKYSERGEGVLLLNNKNVPVGWVDMSAGDMKKLRSGSVDKGSSLLARAISQSNAASFIVRLDKDDDRASRNMANFGQAIGTQMLDALYGKGLSSIGGASPDGSVFFSRATPPTKTDAFKEWFGYSKVRTKGGRPMVVYHATTADFVEFDTSRGDLGAHFGTEEQANNVAENRLGGSGTGPVHIMPVYLKIENPLRLKDVGTFHADGIAIQLEKKGLLPRGEGRRIEKEVDRDWKLRKKYDPLLRDIIIKAGYDGVVYKNTAPGEGPGDSYIAFSPEQIKSATGNNGGYSSSSPDIRLSRSAPQTETDNFKEWFKESRVVDENGDPLVVYHGTTHDFSAFSNSNANIENDFGAGHYFSSEPDDVASNYAGEGPDLTQRIELLKERLDQEISDIGVEEFLYNYGMENDFDEDSDPEEITTAAARKRLHGGAPNTMPVYLSLQNPVIVGGGEETFFDYSYERNKDDLEGFKDDAWEEIRDDNDLEESDREDWEDEIRERAEELYDENGYESEETGSLIDFIEAIRNEASRYDNSNPDQVVSDIMEYAMDDGGISASKLVEVAKQSEGIVYAQDYDNDGGVASSEIIRAAFESMGFDGIIDYTVDQKFGSQKVIKVAYGQKIRGKSMEGMNPDTVHYIAFRPEQIKSAIGNNGDFNSRNPDIRFSLSAPQTKSANFKKWFGNSKAVDKDGNPVELYHGSKNAGFHVFDTEGKGKTKGTGAFFSNSYSMARSYSGSGDDAPSYSGKDLFDNPELIDDLEIEKVYTIIDASGEDVLNESFASEEDVLQAYEPEDGETVAERYTVYYEGYPVADTVTREDAEASLEALEPSSPGIYSAYLKMEDPLEIDWQDKNWDEGPTEVAWEIYDEEGDIYETAFDEDERDRIIGEHPTFTAEEIENPVYENTDDAARQARDMGFDGVIIRNIFDSGPESSGGEYGDVYIVFSPEQIKSSTSNNGDFDPSNPDIRYDRETDRLEAEVDRLRKRTQSLAKKFGSLKSDVEKAIEAPVSELKDVGSVSVVQSETDLPRRIRKAVGKANKLGGAGEIKAIFDPSDTHVYLVADNIKNANGAQRALFHEVYGHKGFRGLFGKSGDKVLMQVFYSDPARCREIARQYGFDLSTDVGKLNAAEELIASLAEANQKPRVMSRVIEYIKSWLAQHGFTVKFTDDQIRAMIARGKKAVTAPSSGNVSASKQTPLWHSRLARQMERKIFDQKKMTGRELVIKLNKAKGQGFSMDEAHALGLFDWLYAKSDDPITLKDVLGFIDANGVQIEEVVKGDGPKRPSLTAIRASEYPRDPMTPSWILTAREGEWVVIRNGEPILTTEADSEAEALRAYSPENDDDYDGEQETKYSQYTLPGGTNYREVLLTLPEDYLDTKETKESRYEYYDRGEGVNAAWRYRIHTVGNVDDDVMHVATEEEAKAWISKNEKREVTRGRRFTSSHWDEKNVIAHIRLNDREVNGEKVLFVEEIQSDWNREGREKGFNIEPTPEQRKALEERANDIQKRLKPEASAAKDAARLRELDAEERAIQKRLANFGVPSAPFVTNNAWQPLALRRVLRMAAEEGHGRVAWITGEQTAERYSLDKQLDSLGWAKYTDEKVDIYIEEKGSGQQKRLGQYALDKLPDVIGKEMADKISKAMSSGEVNGEYSGDDLKIEASWARNLYDKAVPDFMAKMAKQYGAKVETQDVGTGTPQQSIPITQGMKDAFLREGMPMFQRSAAIPSFDAVEENIGKSRGIQPPALLDRIQKSLIENWHSATRHFARLDPKTDGAMMNVLRLQESVSEASKVRAGQMIRDIIGPLSKEEYEVFSYNLILPDLLNDIASHAGQTGKVYMPGDELPFGYEDRAHVEAHLEKWQQKITPAVQQALDLRADIMTKQAEELVQAGQLNASVLDDPSTYYHHQVLDYRGVNALGKEFVGTGMGSDMRVKKKGWQKGRTGSAKDYNTEYIESEFEVLAQGLAMLETHKNLQKIRQKWDIKKRLAAEAKNQNLATMMDVLEERGELETDPKTGKIKDPLLPFRTKIAMGMSRLAKAAEDGDLDGLPSRYDQAIASLHTEESGDIFPLLSYLLDNDHPLAPSAALIFKAIRQRNAFIEEVCGDRFITWRDIVPEDHKVFKPSPGQAWHMASSIADNILERVLQGHQALEDKDVRKMLVRGQDEQWVLPTRLADTMEEMKVFRNETPLGKFAIRTLSMWKQWILINPVRVLKYNINNTSGDLDVVLASYPGILKHLPQALGDLLHYHNSSLRKGGLDPKVKAELEEWTKQGLLSSSMTVNDIPDLTQAMSMEGYLDALSSKTETGVPKKIMGIPSVLWSKSKKYTTLRENLLRLAAARYFAKNSHKKLYGASKKQIVDQITDKNERAALLARELLGDYGNLTEAGNYIRTRVIPFWSWMEINAPRYVRLMANMRHEEGGLSATSFVGKGGVAAFKASKVGLKMLILMALVNAWNHLRYPEETEELGEAGRRQQHLILGRNDAGEIRTIRIQGAFSDALSWIGLEDFPADIRAYYQGDVELSELASDAVWATPKKLLNASRPLEKTGIEALAGKSFYPDPANPRVVNDPVEHVLRSFSLDIPYRHIMGRPAKGGDMTGKFIEELKRTFMYESDPGGVAYYEARSKVFDFLEKEGEKREPSRLSDKGMALLYYKQAQKYGDVAAAKKYLDMYASLGGTADGLRGSIERAHPMASIPKRLRAKFIASMKAGDRTTMERAIEWYEKTYKPK